MAVINSRVGWLWDETLPRRQGSDRRKLRSSVRQLLEMMRLRCPVSNRPFKTGDLISRARRWSEGVENGSGK